MARHGVFPQNPGACLAIWSDVKYSWHVQAIPEFCGNSITNNVSTWKTLYSFSLLHTICFAVGYIALLFLDTYYLLRGWLIYASLFVHTFNPKCNPQWVCEYRRFSNPNGHHIISTTPLFPEFFQTRRTNIPIQGLLVDRRRLYCSGDVRYCGRHYEMWQHCVGEACRWMDREFERDRWKWPSTSKAPAGQPPMPLQYWMEVVQDSKG